MFENADVLIILTSAIGGGAGVKVLDVLNNRRKRRSDTTGQIRRELRQSAEELKSSNRALMQEIEDWKAKYFKMLQEMNDLRIEVSKIRLGLESSIKVDDGVEPFYKGPERRQTAKVEDST